ncbi:hypothetical protein BJX70DRAFT_369510 [Aspergillus crustosus]
MASYSSTSSDQSGLWSSANIHFSIPQWSAETHHQSDQSSGDEQYPFPEMLDFPDVQASSTDRPSTRSTHSPTTTISDGPIEDKSKRRREQNRNAQRAYRERKEKYIKNLLKHIEEMNRNQSRAAESYETLRQEALRLQDQVEDLKSQVEFWTSKTQVVMLRFPEEGIQDSTRGTGASMSVMARSQGIAQSLDPLLGSDITYPTI